jgi:hypothetical protein
MTVSSGSTLGHTSGFNCFIYVYAINNAGTVELAVSSTLLDLEDRVTSTTAEGGAGGADNAGTTYSTTARSNVAFRLIAKLQSSQTTAGTWASAMGYIVNYLENVTESRSTISGNFNFNTSSTSYVDVTSGTASYFCSGRPIKITIVSRTDATVSEFNWSGTSAAAGVCRTNIRVKCLRDSTDLGILSCAPSTYATAGGQGVEGAVMSGGVWYDTPNAGLYVFKLQAATIGATNLSANSITVRGRLLVEEL